MSLAELWQKMGTIILVGNSLREWLIALGVGIGSYILLRTLVAILVRNLPSESTRTIRIDTWIRSSLARGGNSVSILLALWLGVQFIALTPGAEKIWRTAMLVLIVFVCILTVQHVLLRILRGAMMRRGGDVQQFAGVLDVIVRFILWTVGILLVLSNLGINVTSLVAGLGIGGIAVALAAQNILGDIISAFSIFFDKPFRVGDFIIVGPHMGTVQSIGIKTTRLHALQGEEIVIPNRELTSVRIQNFKRMHRRRVEYQFKISSDTPVELVRQVPEMVKSVVAKLEQTTLERVNLKDATKGGLVFEVAYYVEDADHNHFMNVHQEITLQLLEAFREKKIELA